MCGYGGVPTPDTQNPRIAKDPGYLSVRWVSECHQSIYPPDHVKSSRRPVNTRILNFFQHVTISTKRVDQVNGILKTSVLKLRILQPSNLRFSGVQEYRLSS